MGLITLKKIHFLSVLIKIFQDNLHLSQSAFTLFHIKQNEYNKVATNTSVRLHNQGQNKMAYTHNNQIH